MSAHLLVSRFEERSQQRPGQSPPREQFSPNRANLEVLDTSTGADFPDAASQRMVVEIRRRLCSTGHHLLRVIEPEVCGGAVVLRGQVPTYYLKQLAQSVLLTNRLAETIVNLIEVSENGQKSSAVY